jgi:hypothetical protein
MTLISFRTLTFTLLAGAVGVHAHGNHDDHDNSGLTWAERHLREEHHIFNFDAGAFFSLHDFDNSQTWTKDEVLRTYGLYQPESTASEETKEHVWHVISQSMDYDKNGVITAEEFKSFSQAGNTLPDFGVCLFLGEKRASLLMRGLAGSWPSWRR